MSEGWIDPAQAKILREFGVDPKAVARHRQERQANEEFLHHAKRRHFLPPWRVLRLTGDGGLYTNGLLRVMTSVAIEDDGQHWLHVSYSTALRLPTYEEGVAVKELFIGREKKALMVLPPRSQHVNMHPFVLHWFHCLERDPLPDFTSGLGTL